MILIPAHRRRRHSECGSSCSGIGPVRYASFRVHPRRRRRLSAALQRAGRGPMRPAVMPEVLPSLPAALIRRPRPGRRRYQQPGRLDPHPAQPTAPSRLPPVRPAPHGGATDDAGRDHSRRHHRDPAHRRGAWTTGDDGRRGSGSSTGERGGDTAPFQSAAGHDEHRKRPHQGQLRQNRRQQPRRADGRRIPRSQRAGVMTRGRRDRSCAALPHLAVAGAHARPDQPGGRGADDSARRASCRGGTALFQLWDV